MLNIIVSSETNCRIACAPFSNTETVHVGEDAHCAEFYYDREVDDKRAAEPGDQLTREHVDSLMPAASIEPPKVYVAACGTLCDIFWWARRTNQPE